MIHKHIQQLLKTGTDYKICDKFQGNTLHSSMRICNRLLCTASHMTECKLCNTDHDTRRNFVNWYLHGVNEAGMNVKHSFCLVVQLGLGSVDT
jgi:hypothetical protein